VRYKLCIPWQLSHIESEALSSFSLEPCFRLLKFRGNRNTSKWGCVWWCDPGDSILLLPAFLKVEYRRQSMIFPLVGDATKEFRLANVEVTVTCMDLYITWQVRSVRFFYLEKDMFMHTSNQLGLDRVRSKSPKPFPRRANANRELRSSPGDLSESESKPPRLASYDNSRTTHDARRCTILRQLPQGEGSW
jgi:hypothetical protein